MPVHPLSGRQRYGAANNETSGRWQSVRSSQPATAYFFGPYVKNYSGGSTASGCGTGSSDRRSKPLRGSTTRIGRYTDREAPPFDGRRSSGNALRILYARRAVYNRPSTGSEPTQHSVANIPDSKSEKPGIFHGRKLLKPPSTHNDSGALHGGGTPCASSGCWP